MPYQEIKDRFPIPPNQAILSRYFSKEKFESLIRTSVIYLNRIDRFPNLDEIIFSLHDKKLIRERHEKSGKNDWMEAAEKEIANYESLKSCSYINCWTSEYLELRKFWEDYGKSTDAVLVRSSMKKLKVETNKSEFNVQIAGVIYYDPVHDLVGIFNTTKMLSRKPNDFEWEKEVRVIISRFLERETHSDFKQIQIDVATLIDEVIVSPFSNCNYFEEVQAFFSQIGLDKRIVKRSSMRLS